MYCSATTVVASRRKSVVFGVGGQRVIERDGERRAKRILGTKNAVNDFFFFLSLIP